MLRTRSSNLLPLSNVTPKIKVPTTHGRFAPHPPPRLISQVMPMLEGYNVGKKLIKSIKYAKRDFIICSLHQIL